MRKNRPVFAHYDPAKVFLDLLVNTVDAWQWDNRLETASVAKRVLKKVYADWRYTVQPSECEEGWWVV